MSHTQQLTNVDNDDDETAIEGEGGDEDEYSEYRYTGGEVERGGERGSTAITHQNISEPSQYGTDVLCLFVYCFSSCVSYIYIYIQLTRM